MKQFGLEVKDWIKAVCCKRFWKRIVLIVIPLIVFILTLQYTGIVVENYKDSIFNQAFKESVISVNVLVDTIEAQKEKSEDNQIREEWLLDFVKDRVKRFDSEDGINSLMTDEKHLLITERVRTELFCDPWDMPDDPFQFQEALNRTDPSGVFYLVCDGAKCTWYYRDIILSDDKYRIFVGVQPKAVEATLNLNLIYIPLGIIAGLVLICVFTTTFYVLKHHRPKNARTREGDRD